MRTAFKVGVIVAVLLSLAPARTIAQLDEEVVGTPLILLDGEDSAPWAQSRTAAGAVLGWPVAVDFADFAPDYKRAVALTRSFGGFMAGHFVASSTQQAGLSIPRPVGPTLYPNELAEVYGLAKVSAYRIPAFPKDEKGVREVFRFAKDWQSPTIIVSQLPSELDIIERLAKEYDIKIAVCGGPAQIAMLLNGRDTHIGACLDTATLAGSDPKGAVAALGQRLLVVDLRDRTKGALARGVALGQGSVNLHGLFTDIYEANIKPLFVVRRSGTDGDPAFEVRQSLTDLNNEFLPFIGDAIVKASRSAHSQLPDRLPADIQNGIDQTIEAIPSQIVAPPKKPRKLLVLDLNVAYPGHASIPVVNYALKKLADHTGAFQVVFDNNLDNLRYPAIKQFDAIFMNNTVGMIFADATVRESVMQFVQEGGGLAGIHGATHANMDWPDFSKMLGGWGGVHREPTEKVWIKLNDPNSPLNAGFHGEELLYVDEVYRFLRVYSRSNVHELLSIDVAKTDMSQGRPLGAPDLGRPDSDYAISWIRTQGKGHIFYTSLGHNPTLFSTPALAQHMLAGIQFALGDVSADTTPTDSGAAHQAAPSRKNQ
jgi:type 1 glutamine amidotransferase